MAAITGNSHKYENGKRRVDVVCTLRYHRRRLLGDILRAHQNDVRRGEVLMHAELVCRGWQPREGSFVMDAPPHDDVEELKRLAGCPLRGDIADVGVKRAAQRERMMLEWIAADKELKPEEATDSEEEEDEEGQKGTETDQEGSKVERESEAERRDRMAALRAETEQAIAERKQDMRGDGVRYCWLIYHDGGYTSEEDSESGVATSGWGLRAQLFDLDGDSSVVLQTEKAYGPVQLDMDAHSYLGCVVLSNNTAELSAVPHAMAFVLNWRRVVGRRQYGLRVADMLGVIMVYDSQYTKDACTAPPHVPKPVKNRTAIVVCQRTLQAAADKRVLVQCKWVKVKGHSNEEGNDMADKLADYAQKGGAQNEQDIAMMMAGLQATDD